MIRFAPSSAAAFAVANPNPELAPKIITFLFFNVSIFYLKFLFCVVGKSQRRKLY
jgi:hypothetical protein